MKKHALLWVVISLLVTMLAGCTSAPAGTSATVPTQGPATAPTTAPTTMPTEGTTAPEDPTQYYIEQVYPEQIGRYYTALAEKWEDITYVGNGMSALPGNYYDGDPMNNVGFSLMDLNNDGIWELVIGAILNAEQNPVVFEIWTATEGEPVMLAQSSANNTYALQYVQEEQRWQIANEATNNIASRGVYFLQLKNGELEVIQGVVFDAFADEENPWFQTLDLDWDTANDQHIDEETASSIIDANRALYVAPEYLPFASYEGGENQQPPKTLKEQLLERAAALSERFNVDIRIPEQSQLNYTDYDAYPLEDLSFIRSSLDALEEVMRQYPEGFFTQLAYGGMEPLRIELVGNITVKAGMEDTIGPADAFAQNKGSYHLIVANGHFVNTTKLFHEISHVIDRRLIWDMSNRQEALFSEATWLSLQPEGFYYAKSYVSMPEQLLRFLDSGYFQSWYSLTYPTEDRATMMEMAMAGNSSDFAPGSGRRAKLQYYADCIRDAFDTTGWPEVTAWEQVLQ